MPSRRTVAKGVAWAAPAVTIAAAAPSLAASTVLRKDPGVNGWVLNTTRPQRADCAFTLEVDSTPTGTGPDGAPFGLYLYDVEPAAVASAATLTYWIIGSHAANGSTRVTWSTKSGHSSTWSGPVRGTPTAKSDGVIYTPYVWTSTAILRGSQVSSDGRLHLGDFHVQAAFTQGGVTGAGCSDVTYWTQRSITIDTDGGGPRASTSLTLERRNGSRGQYSGGARAARRRAAGDGEGGLPS